jgi:hypothetical protein
MQSLPSYLNVEQECIVALIDRIGVAEKECRQLDQESQAWKDLSIAIQQKVVDEKLQKLHEDIAEDSQAIVSLQNYMWETIFMVSTMPLSGAEMSLKAVLTAQMPKLSSMLSRCAEKGCLCRPSNAHTVSSALSIPIDESPLSEQQWQELKGSLPDSLRTLLTSLSLVVSSPVQPPSAAPYPSRAVSTAVPGAVQVEVRAPVLTKPTATPAAPGAGGSREKKGGNNRSNNSKPTGGGGSGNKNGSGGGASKGNSSSNRSRPTKQQTAASN